LMLMVSGHLNVGGYFIGTTIDEMEIRKTENQTGKLYSVQPTIPFGPRKPYGNEYSFEILDSFDQGNYFNTMGVSKEYLVKQSEFIKVAKKYNLVPCKNFFESYTRENKTEFANSDNPFVPFSKIVKLWTPKKNSRSMNDDELKLNNLYTTFVFKKI